MLTLHRSGTYEKVRAEAAGRADALRAAGFDVVRTKIEAAPWTAGVPSTDEEAVGLGPGYYFEHHLKLLLARFAPLESLLAIAVGHGAHLSRNARRVRSDGRVERFVTQRCRMVGLGTAGQRLDALSGQLRAAGLHLAALEREFVVYDGNLALDAGWLDGEERALGGQGIAEVRWRWLPVVAVVAVVAGGVSAGHGQSLGCLLYRKHRPSHSVPLKSRSDGAL
ncbi:hypothetical protein [Streptomyces sp. NPDC020742]|uniref:hypothetical protein n=1 Tax=Streptomyces sp. NPDC020742 TaxID=3154897 RepID=UPI0033D23348